MTPPTDQEVEAVARAIDLVMHEKFSGIGWEEWTDEARAAIATLDAVRAERERDG